jgi:ABC-type multidrug transport system fused ATPase/permease subunit
MKGRTVVMIAHRMSTLENCDMYLQLQDGRIVSTDAPGALAPLSSQSTS